jgi:hypothetical protein
VRKDDKPSQDEVAAAVAIRAENAVKADLARRAEGGSDVAMGQAAGDGEGVLLGGNDNFFARLKQFRAIATRYDKTARNFLAAIYLAASVVWLN